MAWTLASKEEVTSLHQYPANKIPDFWSDIVEGMIREHLGTPTLGEPTAVVNETHDGDGTNLLIVRKPPIVSVQELRISGVALLPAEFVQYETRIELANQVFPEGVLNVQVDYTSGGTVPPTVKMTAIAMIAAMINYQRRYGADSSLKWGEGEQEIGESTPNLNVGLTSHLTTIMKRMLRRIRIRAN